MTTSHATTPVHIPSRLFGRSTRNPDETRPQLQANPLGPIEQSRSGVLLRPRLPFKLATFNVRTLMQVGQQAGLAHTMDTLGIDVCCLSETRLQDVNSRIRLTPPSNPDTAFYLRLSGDAVSAAAGLAGTGIALSKKAEAALLDWIPIDSRLCAVRLRGSCRVSKRRECTRNLFVISAYAPTDCSPDSVKDSFYQNLHDLLRSAKKADIIILAGDFNARIGRLSPSEQNLGGPYGLEHDRTDNGERLLKLCCDHHLYLASLNFRRSKRRLATWSSPSASQGLFQIDHIAISFRWRGSVQNCRSYWTTSVDSDHALVCATISMRFGGKPKSTAKRIDISKLTAEEIGEKYRQVLTDSLATECPSSLEGRWCRLRSACIAAGLDTCGTTQLRHQTWISRESIVLFDAHRSLPDPTHIEQKRELRRQLRASLRKDREVWWACRAREMEVASSCGNTRKLFQLIRATGPKRSVVSETIRESNGSVIRNMSRRLERWAEHFSAQFNRPQSSDVESLDLPEASWPVSLQPPTEVEVRAVLLSLKRHKAPGSDNLPAELLREGGDPVVAELCSLFRMAWECEKIPSSWGDSIIIPIFKKGQRSDCANYRGISLIPVVSKVFASLLLRRLSPHRELVIGEEQAGFRPGRGCIDQIFALRQILEHRHTYRRPTIIVFLDIRAAFDSVDRAMLWDILLREGVPRKYVTLLQELYRHTSGKVRAYGTLSERFSVMSGVRQGCPLSPFLFNFAIEKVLASALEDMDHPGIELLPGGRLSHLDYADDIALIGEDPQVTQQALDRLVHEAAKYGLAFAPEKCKVLIQDMDPSFTLCISGLQLEVVEWFEYLGSRIASRDTGSMECEVTSRIAKARGAFASLRHLWRRRDISLQLKGRVYAASVRAVLLYGCETWPMRVEDIKRLSAFDSRCLRGIARVWWEQRVSNSEVRRRVLGEKGKDLETIISEQSLRWLGHVLRMPPHRLPRRALLALPGSEWKKPPGGQKMTWRKRMKSLTACLASVGAVRLPGWGVRDGENSWLETLEEMARDRNQWRECCRSCIYHIGTSKPIKSTKRRV